MAIKITNLPNGKVMVDGVTMSATTFKSRYKMTPAGKVSIASNPDKKSASVTKQGIKIEKKAAKKNTRLVKKVDKANYSSGADAARKKVAERAKAIVAEKRTAAQTRAIKTEARYKAGLPGYSPGPITKGLKKEQKEIEKKAARKSRGFKAPRIGGGLRGGPLGGGGGLFGKIK